MHSVPSNSSPCYANPPIDPSLFNYNASFHSSESDNVSKSAASDIHAVVEHIGNKPHKPHPPANKVESAIPYFITAPAFDAANAEYTPLTCHALRDHNIKNKMRYSDNNTHLMPSQNDAYGATSSSIARYPPTSASDEHTTGACHLSFCHLRHLQIPATSQQEHKQNISPGEGQCSTEQGNSYFYPTFIQQDDLDQAAGQAQAHVEFLAIEQELSEGPCSSNSVLAGVGGQFWE